MDKERIFKVAAENLQSISTYPDFTMDEIDQFSRFILDRIVGMENYVEFTKFYSAFLDKLTPSYQEREQS